MDKKTYNRLRYLRIKEQDKVRLKKWYQDHKEEMQQRGREVVICENCGTSLSRSCLSRHKRSKKCRSVNEQVESDDDVIVSDREKRKRYYEANKANIQAKRAVPVQCDVCGKTVTKKHIQRHKKTKKCMKARKQARKQANEQVELVFESDEEIEIEIESEDEGKEYQRVN